jgi:hypothetical protein
MLRACLASAVIVALFAICVAQADDKGKDNDKDKQRNKATITKVDAKNGTITVRMKDKEGKDVTKTFRLTEDVVYLDSNGQVARIDVFQSGDDVLVLEREGKLKELRKDSSKKSDGKDKGSGSR